MIFVLIIKCKGYFPNFKLRYLIFSKNICLKRNIIQLYPARLTMVKWYVTKRNVETSTLNLTFPF